MKNRPLLAFALATSSLSAGCAWFPWGSDDVASSSRGVQGRIIPHARIQDGADSAAAFHALGRHLQREGRWDDAERAFRRALDFDAAHAESRNALAVLAASRGDLTEAIATLSSLVALHPERPHLLANLGYAHYLNGDYVQAKEKLVQALAIAPDSESVRQKLALVKEKLGESSEEPEELPMAADSQIPAIKEQDRMDRNPIVKITEGVYQLMRLLGNEIPKPYVARCELPENTPLQATPKVTVSQSYPLLSRGYTDKVRLELVNGNGINRLARSVRDLISGSQWQVVRVINHDEFSVPVTRIEYAKHRYGAASDLAGTLGVAAQLRPNYQQGDTQLRVVLGRDFQTTEGLRQRVAESMPRLAGTE